MKKFVLLLLCTVLKANFVIAQEDVRMENFILKNGEIFWQKTFNIDSTTCNKYFKEKPFIDYKECQITLANYSSKSAMSRAFILNYPSTIHFSLQVKEDRYRITISNIIFESSTSIGLALGSGVVAGQSSKNHYDLKFYAYNKKGKITFKKTIATQLDEALSKLFDATKNQNGDEHSEVLSSDF